MGKKVIVTGGTGFIGKKLCRELTNSNYDVFVLTRNVQKAKKIFSDKVTPVQWDGKSSNGWIDYANGAYAIINLAGENIGSGRWTGKKKQKILISRLNAGKAIVEALTQAENKPKVLIQASGISIYGDRGDELLDESTSFGTGFLVEIGSQWEQSVKGIETMGVRIVYLRSGVVISKDGGFLSRVLLPFKFFIGGHFGTGQQWFPWIHIDDEVRVILFLLDREDLHGIFNLMAPNPLTSKDFFKTLGKVMKRPSWFHVPGFLLKIIFGEMANELILWGQRTMPKRLLDAGFEFNYPEAENALRQILN